MKIFEYSSTYVTLEIFGIFVGIVNLYLIYTIWKHSPSSMGFFRYHLLKMVICDFCFTLSIFYLMQPNLIFPITGATIMGICKHFGKPGAIAAHVTTVWIGALTQWTILDCCMFRFFVFFKKDWALEWFSGRKAVIYFLSIATFLNLYLASFLGLTVMTYEELVAYAKQKNITEFMRNNVHPDTPFIAYDMSRVVVIIDNCLILFFLVLVETSNMSLSLAVHKKINQVKGSLSAQTYKMQRSLTYVMIAQITIPAVGIIIPVPFYLLSSYSDVMLNVMDAYSLIIEWLSVITVAGYPLANSIFTILTVSAYRKATITNIKKILFCFKFRDDDETIIINLSSIGSTGTAPVK